MPDRRRYRGAVSPDEPRPSRTAGRPLRRPRMVPFLLTGTLIGALGGTILSVLRPRAPLSGPAQEVIVLAVVGGILGLLVGSLAFLAVERRRR